MPHSPAIPPVPSSKKWFAPAGILLILGGVAIFLGAFLATYIPAQLCVGDIAYAPHPDTAGSPERKHIPSLLEADRERLSGGNLYRVHAWAEPTYIPSHPPVRLWLRRGVLFGGILFSPGVALLVSSRNAAPAGERRRRPPPLKHQPPRHDPRDPW